MMPVKLSDLYRIARRDLPPIEEAWFTGVEPAEPKPIEERAVRRLKAKAERLAGLAIKPGKGPPKTKPKYDAKTYQRIRRLLRAGVPRQKVAERCGVKLATVDRQYRRVWPDGKG
jgi:hypothetical protein